MKGPLKRIEIAGGIASGKTTLARLLKRVDLAPVHENFRKNPFYLAFYRDPSGTALETEITFLLQHYHEQKRATASRRSFCADFSLLLDHAYACVTLPRSDQRLFEVVLRRVGRDLPKRSLLIHLVCTPETELKRIRRRQRHAERAITLNYLKDINRTLELRVKAVSGSENILTIDSGIVDFAQRRQSKTDVLARVRKALAGR